MAPKSKRKRQSAAAAAIGRESIKKLKNSSGESLPTTTDSTVSTSEPAVTDSQPTTDPSDSTSGPSNTGVDMRDDDSQPRTQQEIMEEFAEEWLMSLDHDDKKSLSMFLCFNLGRQFSMKDTEAAVLVAQMVGKSDRTIRQWRSDLVGNDGEMPESQQGKYQREGVLWHNEELNKVAREYVHNNSSIKGKPNMTVQYFCKWVNKSLLPNLTLEPGFPRKVSMATARRWLHQMGFEVITPRKGIFIDGHERDDVVESRKMFLRRMVKIGFVHITNAPTDSSRAAIPTDLEPPTLDRCSKTVVFFHDESTFNSNDDQNLKWGVKGEKIMKKKSKGAGIMVSDFIDEHQGFLALSDAEYEAAKKNNPSIKPYAREFLEYGEGREGYWNRDKFMLQMERAVQISEIKYPKGEGWRHVWIFDHSSCHAAMADDALDVNRMNVKSGGKQRIMRDTVYDGRTQKMYFTERGQKVAKGMRIVLEERGISTAGKKWRLDARHPCKSS